VAFPKFDPGKQKLLFFSRGRGRGHAIPDSEIVKELQELRDDVDVRFVSYGTGARTIRELRYPLIDLDLPDDNPLFDTVILAGKIIGWLQPHLVVAHEEFAVLPAAKIFDRKVLFLTDWFVEETDLRMGMLRFADQILFLDHKEIYEEPSCVRGRIAYLDPIVRDLRYSRKDKERARAELGMPANAFVAGVFPGSPPERREPIVDLVLGALHYLPPNAVLHWVGGSDADLLSRLAAAHEKLHFCPLHQDIGQYYVACDVAITKATRKTLFELEYLGIPSVSLTHGYNRIDDRRARSLRNTTLIEAKSIAAPELAGLLVSQAAREPAPSSLRPGVTARRAASRISAHLVQVADAAAV
jgi:UDP-N-acetylglucosamine:LPS N-acetylglucosamine transferase